MTHEKIKSLDMSTITVCKNYMLRVLHTRHVDRDIIDDVLNSLSRLSVKVLEVKQGKPAGTYKPNLRVRTQRLGIREQ